MEETDARVLREAVEGAAGRAEVREAVAGLYGRLQRAVELRKPICVVSGRCCRFDEFGHRLYVTTMELATFTHELRLRAPVAVSDEACPFQARKLCTVHDIRPFGCRVFFCDSTSTAWQQQQYEEHHGRLKQMHEQMGVAYFYVEWREALAALGVPERNANVD